MTLHDEIDRIVVPPLPFDAIVRRGHQLRRQRLALMALGALASVAVIAAGATSLRLGAETSRDRVTAGPVAESVEVNVFLHDSIKSQERNHVRRAARDLDGALNVRYVSKAAAFREFKTYYATQPEFWEELPADALPARFVLTMRDESGLAEARRELGALPGVDDILRADEAPKAGTPRVVASGETAGRTWDLYAYTTDSDTDGGPGLLCQAFRFDGVPPGDDFACHFGGNSALVPPQFIAPTGRIDDNGPIVFYGRVSLEAEDVTIRFGGSAVPAEIYPSPTELGADYDFFVAFVPRGTDKVTFVVKDAGGETLERRTEESLAPD